MPEANPTDGLLHITAMEQIKLRQIPSALKLLFAGRLPEHPCAHSFVTTKFTMEYESAIDAETDGVELCTTTPLQVEIVPQALHMLIP